VENIHTYSLELEWTGNLGSGTSAYKAYSRDHVMRFPGKPDIQGSSDPQFRGDSSRHNPEEMLVAALSACHMLWFLHLCADAGVIVTSYHDRPTGTMGANSEGKTVFKEVILRPEVTLADASKYTLLPELHHRAHDECFLANSMNFPVTIRP
jgi:organic hydroperoxide reductase OsmC/OhrA